ncbi:MAG TPA: hypothetical protein VFW25_15270 [Silvibacterium sp.]|nr:hypothetical protein [Silvibacterium sp.]
MIVDLLNQFGPDSEGLLREISKYIDDEVLASIAAADYGMDQERHLVALRQIRDTNTFPQEMYRYPAEVLELIRWSEPEDHNWKPGETGEFGHWMRAFSCAALLRATREPWKHGDGIGSDSALVQMILSLRALPVDFTDQAISFLAWLLLRSEPEGQDEQVCAYAVGLLWYALQRPALFSDGTLTSLGEWVIQKGEQLFGSFSSGNFSGLRGMVIHCQKRSSWEHFGIRLLEMDLSGRSRDLRAYVELIAEQLVS